MAKIMAKSKSIVAVHQYALGKLSQTIICQGRQAGVSLIELIVFIIIISVALVTLLKVFSQGVSHSVDPIVQVRALECAQSKLEEILARKFDENSPTGGVPACGSAELNASNCAGIVSDSDYDDVGDYNGQVDTANADCTITVTVSEAGNALSLPNNEARLIRVDVTSPGGGNTTLSAYKVNF